MTEALLIAAIAGIGWLVSRAGAFGGATDTDSPGADDPDDATNEATVIGGLVVTVEPGPLGPTGLGGGEATSYPWQTDPPTYTGSDPKGYSTATFPSPTARNTALRFLGYNAPGDSSAGSAVTAFQRHYNQGSAEGFADTDGYLDDDGVSGVKTLVALQRAIAGIDGAGPADVVRGLQWQQRFGLGAF